MLQFTVAGPEFLDRSEKSPYQDVLSSRNSPWNLNLKQVCQWTAVCFPNCACIHKHYQSFMMSIKLTSKHVNTLHGYKIYFRLLALVRAVMPLTVITIVA